MEEGKREGGPSIPPLPPLPSILLLLPSLPPHALPPSLSPLSHTPSPCLPQVFLKFSGNRASIGPVVFISHLLHCSWYSAKISNETNEIVIIFNNQSFANWTAFD